ncbi:hypothetical protein D3C87_1380780 [compost metagenome]
MFPSQLGLPIDVERCSFIALDPRALATAIKYVIGRVVDQPGAQRFGFFGNRSHAGGVEQFGEFPLAFRLVDGGVGRCIDNYIRLEQTHRVGHACRVAEIAAIVGGIEVDCGDSAQRGE